MSKRAWKAGTDGEEALRGGAAWTPMLGIIVYFIKEGGKW
jgi:hypothetical protein